MTQTRMDGFRSSTFLPLPRSEAHINDIPSPKMNKSTPKNPQAKAEDKLLQHFVNISQDRLEKIDRTSSDNFRLEPHERDILLDINNSGIFKGTLTGMGSLVLLRYGRASIANRLARRAAEQYYTRGNVHNIVGSAQPFQSPRSRLMNIFGWVLDSAVAFSIAATSSLYFTDVDKVRHQLESLPLTSGRSRVAQEFCPPIIQAVRELSPDDKSLLKDTKNAYLQSIRTFHYNCHCRSIYERRLRREKELSDSYLVQIPEGGVPTGAGLMEEGDWEQEDEFAVDTFRNDEDKAETTFG